MAQKGLLCHDDDYDYDDDNDDDSHSRPETKFSTF
jgi:hypothetical protein